MGHQIELFGFTISSDATLQNWVTHGLSLIMWDVASIVSFGSLFGSSRLFLKSTFSHGGSIMIYSQPMLDLHQLFRDPVEDAFGAGWGKNILSTL